MENPSTPAEKLQLMQWYGFQKKDSVFLWLVCNLPMHKMNGYCVLLLFISIVAAGKSQNSNQDIHLSNMGKQCMSCLCFAATSCNLSIGCVSGYCGPYKISRIYWIDAGKVILPEDQVEREGAYEDCAINYHCAQKIMTNYLVKYGRDCNGDGHVNCEDYSKINFNGGYQCDPPLNRTDAGKNWLERFYSCYPRTPDAEF